MAIERKGKRLKKTETNEAALLALEGQLPPHNLEAEASVLGALLLEQNAFSRVSEKLKAEDFYLTKHQNIYSAIVELSINQIPIDLISVTEQLRKNSLLEQSGGETYIASIIKPIFSTPFLEHHANVILEKSLCRKLIALSSDVLRNAYDSSVEANDLVQAAEQALFEISQNNSRKDFKELKPVMVEVMDGIKKAMNQSGGLSGLPSGFDDLDHLTSGWQNSDLIIIAARPAMGKTAFVLSMARNMAIDKKIPVAVFNLEMNAQQLGNRIVSNYCEIDSNRIKSGRLSNNELLTLNRSLPELYSSPLYINDAPALSVFELRSQARRLVKDKGVKMIIIDYLQLMTASGMNPGGSQEQEISIISRSLKILAKELDIPIVALSQLNRKVEDRTGDGNSKLPQLSDLRGSGAIEQDADIVCFLHRPEYYKQFVDSEGVNMVGRGTFIIAKHRNGPVGDIILEFDAPFTKFRNRDLSKDGKAVGNMKDKFFGSSKGKLNPQEPVKAKVDNNPPPL